MAGISFSGRRQSEFSYNSQTQQWSMHWGDWKNAIASDDTDEEVKDGVNGKQFVCYRYSVNYNNARALMALSIIKRLYATIYVGDPVQNVSVGAYLYLSDPTGGTSTNVPSGYVAYASISSGRAYGTSVTFNLTCPTITADTIYVLYTLTSNNGANTDVRFNSNGEYDQFTSTFKGMPTSLNVSPTTVSTGGNLNISIGNYFTTETVRFYYGTTQLASTTITNGSGSYTIPKSWFTTAGITTGQTMTVVAKLDDTNLTKNFTVQAGSDMRPTVTTPSVSIVQDPAASYYPSTYISNVSKAKVQVTVTSGSNATISSVRLEYTGGSPITMSLVNGKYEATTGTLKGNTTFTVTVTDSRGLSTVTTYTLTGVVNYVPPQITIDEGNTFRCNSGGTKQDGGIYFRAKCSVTVTTSGLSGNQLTSLRVYIQEEPSKTYTLTNNQQSGANSGRSGDYYETLVFEAKDRILTVTKAYRLPPATRNLTMKRSSSGTYVGIGVLPQHSTGKSTVDLEEGGGYYEGVYLWGSLTKFHDTSTGGTQFSKNFKNVNTSMLYSSANTECYFNKTGDSGWSNSPVSGAFSGVRKVIWISGSIYLIVILEFAPTAGRLWFSYNGGTWKSLTPA